MIDLNAKARINQYFGKEATNYWRDMLISNVYCDTDGIIKLKEVNKMKDWITVHMSNDDAVAIIRKDCIRYIGKSIGGKTVIHTDASMYEVNEEYTNIVRRLTE